MTRRFFGLSLLGAGVGLAAILAGKPVVDHYEQAQAWPFHDARVSQFDADLGLGGMTHFLSFYRNAMAVILAFSADYSTLKTCHLPLPGGSFQGTRAVIVQKTILNGKHVLAVHIEGIDTTLVVAPEQFK